MSIFSAADAWAQTQQTIAERTASAESKIMVKINDAILRGDHTVMLSIGTETTNVQATLRQALTAAGYSVTDHASADQRDYGYITISWLTAQPPEV